MAEQDDRFSELHDFEPNEITSHGRTNGRVRELSDPDAYVMLGRLASAVARLETGFAEAAREWKLDREEWRQDRQQLLRMQRKQGRRSAGLVAGLVVIVQAVAAALHSAGVIK